MDTLAGRQYRSEMDELHRAANSAMHAATAPTATDEDWEAFLAAGRAFHVRAVEIFNETGVDLRNLYT